MYDYEFVKRAYAMLKMNGVLVAIIGRNWMKNNEMKKWFIAKSAHLKNDTVTWQGDGLKDGGTVAKLDITYVKIVRLEDDVDDTQNLLNVKFIK